MNLETKYGIGNDVFVLTATTKKCLECKGKGHIRLPVTRMAILCPLCNGRGYKDGRKVVVPGVIEILHIFVHKDSIKVSYSVAWKENETHSGTCGFSEKEIFDTKTAAKNYLATLGVKR